ncbi:thioesterase-like superfamily-domain-containing protein [Xylogone sp. PMI_703]|nr:thioesterase-like superfamily-domain-containing protein [Xylogone sp. PMI_703]
MASSIQSLPRLSQATNHLRIAPPFFSQSHLNSLLPTTATRAPRRYQYYTSALSQSHSHSHPPSNSTTGAEASLTEPTPSQSRWLSTTKSRIGKCILWGLDQEQTRRAAAVLKILGEEWRELVAGQEGFLTSRKRAGLLRHKVVWGEMDRMAHINNVTYVRYAESARINWAYNYAVHIDPKNQDKWSELWTNQGDGLILRSMRTDYKFPMTWPDHISVFHKLRHLPKPFDTSFILDVMILSELHQRPAARCVEDIVVYDYRKGKKMVIPPFVMNGFQRTWEEQEEARENSLKRIGEVEKEVRKLETESWDREGAVEDLGSAA